MAPRRAACRRAGARAARGGGAAQAAPWTHRACRPPGAGGRRAAADDPAARRVAAQILPSYQRTEEARQNVGADVEPRRRAIAAMSVLIKICGLKTSEALDVALAAGADLVGFVFFAPSPRHVGIEAARALGARVRGRAQKVALSVDAGDDELAASIDALEPDLLQLHGKETAERVVMVRERFGLPVMKALPIAERADLAAIRRYEEVADRLIFDARAGLAATRRGGLGTRFDWRLLENAQTRAPFILSGGLDALNVVEALRITAAPGVDVSSGVERTPGEKDADKIRAFIAAARDG